MANRIVLISTAGRQEQEADANAAINPGNLLEVLSTGKVQKHATEGGLAERSFATEDALQGNTIATAYAADDKVFIVFALPGDVINALIKADPGTNIAVGDVLISDGAGRLIAETEAATATTVADRVAIAVEAIDLSATGAVDTHAAVRIL